MSRLSKQPIAIPSGVEIKHDGSTVTIKGPKGELSRNFNNDVISFDISDSEIAFAKAEDTVFARALIGTYASHIMNMIHGVTEGFEKKLIVEGVGFRSDVKGNNLEMSLGYSHPVIMEIPEGITTTAEKNVITVSGIDKERTMQFAAQIRAKKKPEPYKGKGIRYEGEIIRRKQGKKSA
ncbi:50S ribosomal protein L6 [Candidatus Campbellbacteria bacterium]|nr:50S ribosomal protein L6 [Candidatus Campbellbacteria bacterium]|tara:strand:- start:48 stop:584 length:537 start_codon:yes stop_codon:yes gene_type:complete